MSLRSWSIGPVLCALALGTGACKRDATPAGETGALAGPPAGDGGAAQPAEAPADPASDAPADAATEPAKPEGDAGGTTDSAVDAGGATSPGDTAPAAADPVKPAGAGALPAALHTKVDAACGKDPGVGTKALPFQLKTAEGKDVSMASLKGKVVLLNFWGTWCKPCKKELPEFDRLVRHYRKHGAVLVAVATDTDPQPVADFARERKISAKFALGGEALAKQYDSPSFPFSFVVDDKGTIRGSYRGYKPECIGKIEQDLRASLEARGK